MGWRGVMKKKAGGELWNAMDSILQIIILTVLCGTLDDSAGGE